MYEILPFEDITSHENDIFHHQKVFGRFWQPVSWTYAFGSLIRVVSIHAEEGNLLPAVQYECVHETRSLEAPVPGVDAVMILNGMQRQGNAKFAGPGTPHALTLLEYLLYCILRLETKESGSSLYGLCLDRLQQLLNEMKKFGPCRCSKLRARVFGSTICGMHNTNADVDICIDGHIDFAPSNTWNFDNTGMLTSVVRFSKQKFLHELADMLLESGVAAPESLERIIHARVPVFNYVDRLTGLRCDVIVGNESFRFKATALAILGQVDWRFLALVRLVKLWAAKHHLVDASLGLLNSYSLKLLVLFHLQNRPVPILPKLSESSKAIGGLRPIQNSTANFEFDNQSRDYMISYIRALSQNAVNFARERNSNNSFKKNRETLSELFVSFMRFLQDLTNLEGETSDFTLMQRLKVDAWDGLFSYVDMPDTDRAYHLYVRDPFEDKPDNAARSLSLAGEREVNAQTQLFCHRFESMVKSSNDNLFTDMLHLVGQAFGHELSEKSDALYQQSMHEIMSLDKINYSIEDLAGVGWSLLPDNDPNLMENIFLLGSLNKMIF